MMIKNIARPTAIVFGFLMAGCATPPVGPAAQVPEIAPSNVQDAVRYAQVQRVSGDIDGAIRTLSQLVIAAPDDSRVLGEYGKALVVQGKTGDAVAFLQRAIELNPNDWMLYSAQG